MSNVETAKTPTPATTTGLVSAASAPTTVKGILPATRRKRQSTSACVPEGTIEILLAANLSRRFVAIPSGNGKAALLTEKVKARVHEYHRQGKGASEIGRLLAIDRKQVAKILADAT